MYKILSLSLVISLISLSGFAQDELQSLKKEISQIKSQVENANNHLSKNSQKLDKQLAHIKKQDEKIESYERALNLLEPKHTAKFKDIVFNIKEVIGNISSSTVTFKGILVNEGNSEIKFSSSLPEYFDNEGNQYKNPYSIKYGHNNYLTAIPNTPVKFEIKFSNVDSGKVAKVTALKLPINHGFNKENILFKSMDIEWED